MIVSSPSSAHTREFRFGRFTLDRGGLLKDGKPAAISPKPLALLRELAARDGGVVTREELLAAIWGSGGSQESLTRCVYLARLALDDVGPQRPRFIEAVYGVGYRFLPPEE